MQQNALHMKTILKSIVGLVAAGLIASLAVASSVSVNDSDTMVPGYNHNWLHEVYVTTASTTFASSYGSLSTGYSAGGGMNFISPSGTILFYYTMASNGPGPSSGSGIISGQPAGTYKVVHGVSGVDGVSWSFNTTVSW